MAALDIPVGRLGAAEADDAEAERRAGIDALAGEDDADEVQYDLEGAPLFAERDQGDML